MLKKIYLSFIVFIASFSLNAEIMSPLHPQPLVKKLEVENPIQEKILRRSCDAEPAEFNIHTATDAHTFSILRDLYETLVEFQPDGSLKPAAAEKWDVSEDKKTYIFHLRKNAKWSNGDPVTAHDFVFSWRHLVNPKTACPYANHTYMIKNAEEIVKGKRPAEDLGVRALDDYRFEVTLDKPLAASHALHCDNEGFWILLQHYWGPNLPR